MDRAEFDYHLPEELIAQEPLGDRAGARMLVVYRVDKRQRDQHEDLVRRDAVPPPASDALR